MQQPNADQVVMAMKRLGYKVFDQQNYDLNLVGIRTNDLEADTFNDWFMVIYTDSGAPGEKNQVGYAFPCTTDPGVYYRRNLANVDGTAIMVPGQYRGAYKIGKHRGEDALVQRRPITVYRDRNMDETLDMGPDKQAGLYGINIHKANPDRRSTIVDRWSAGCQVIADPMHFAFIMALAHAGAKIFGNSFTYTLLTEDQILV